MTNHDDEADEKPIDLSAIDPFGVGDSQRFDDFVRRVRTAATPELLRRQATPDLGGLVVRWRRGILAVATLFATAAVVGIFLSNKPATAGGTLAEAIGIPSTWADWMVSETTPSPADLMKTIGSEQ